MKRPDKRAKRPGKEKSHTVGWWPPRVRDRLRHTTLHGAGPGRVKRVEALLRVLAVFDHEGSTRVVTAEWLPTRRSWSYKI